MKRIMFSFLFLVCCPEISRAQNAPPIILQPTTQASKSDHDLGIYVGADYTRSFEKQTGWRAELSAEHRRFRAEFEAGQYRLPRPGETLVSRYQLASAGYRIMYGHPLYARAAYMNFNQLRGPRCNGSGVGLGISNEIDSFPRVRIEMELLAMPYLNVCGEKGQGVAMNMGIKIDVTKRFVIKAEMKTYSLILKHHQQSNSLFSPEFTIGPRFRIY